jgi:tryptophanyl-tRNA synthetase
VNENCRTAGIGCVDCKRRLLERLVPDQERLREQREKLLAQPDYVRDVVRDGTARARSEAGRTMDQVRAAMHLDQNSR